MQQEKSTLSEILERKIPQIIGMYIASVWLAVEISDWMSGRFELPAQFSTYVFVGMLTLLPSVILVAWGHGKSGKDEWTMFEKTWIPINVLLVFVVINYTIKPLDNLSDDVNIDPVDSNQLVNSQPQKDKPLQISSETFEVLDQAYHQPVISYFWENKTKDENLDWLSYGISWLLAQDLKRTPHISVDTPYDSDSLLSQLTNKGFDRALGAPVSLELNVANNRSSKWMIHGSYKMSDGQLELNAELYNVETGQLVQSKVIPSDDWISSLDEISESISETIFEASKVPQNIIPQLAIVEHTSLSIKAIKYLIQAKNYVAFKNDYQKAIKELDLALEADASFAEANVLGLIYYKSIGDFANSTAHAKKALELDYKLYQESVFLVKASLLGMQQGQQANAIKVLENWVKIYPNSSEALTILGRNYIVLGNHQTQAIEVFKKLYEVEGPGHKSLVSLAKIYRLQNDKDNALDYLNQYLQAHPTLGEAYFELADAYKQFAMFDEAKNMYEEASLYDNKDFKAEIGLANIVASKGDYQLAIEQLQALLELSKTDAQRLNILTQIQTLYTHTGQITKGIEIVDLIEEPGKKEMPPLNYTFQVEGYKALMYSFLGQHEKSLTMISDLVKDLKPPFDKLSKSFTKLVYEHQKDIENFKKEFLVLEKVMQSLNLATLKPEILRSKSLMAFWDEDYPKALDFINQAIEMTTQSMVTLITTQQVDSFVYEKAKILNQLEQHDQALAELEILLNRTPLYVNAHVLKARIYHNKGDQENVSKSLEAAHHLWQYADKEYIEYKKLVKFEQQLNSQD